MDRKAMLLTALLAATVALPARAQVKEVTLRVDGLACPFCAYGVEKKLKALEGYRSLDVHINEGKIIVGWQGNKPLNLPAIEEAIQKAGFTLRGVRGHVTGRVVRREGRYFLTLPKPSGQQLLLCGPDACDTGAGLGAGLQERLRTLASDGKAVDVVGPIRAPHEKDASVMIGIETIVEEGDKSQS